MNPRIVAAAAVGGMALAGSVLVVALGAGTAVGEAGALPMATVSPAPLVPPGTVLPGGGPGGYVPYAAGSPAGPGTVPGVPGRVGPSQADASSPEKPPADAAPPESRKIEITPTERHTGYGMYRCTAYVNPDSPSSTYRCIPERGKRDVRDQRGFYGVLPNYGGGYQSGANPGYGSAPYSGPTPYAHQAPSGTGVSRFATCSAARAAGVSNIPRTSPDYATNLDADNDGTACEATE